jgi:hypothetical protein
MTELVFDVTDSREGAAMTWIEAKPSAASVDGLFSRSPDRLREIFRIDAGDRKPEMIDAVGAGRRRRSPRGCTDMPFRLCSLLALNQRLDENLKAFALLGEPFPYLILDSLYEKSHQGGIV